MDVHLFFCPASKQGHFTILVSFFFFFFFFSLGFRTKDFQSNGHSTTIPLEVIYEDKTVHKTTFKGHSNPEFIGDDEDDDNDIYKAQLLLFLKQSHLIRPHIYPEEQDNNSDTSDYSRKNSRKVSAISTASDKVEEDTNEPAADTESAQVYDTTAVTVSIHAVMHKYLMHKYAMVDKKNHSGKFGPPPPPPFPPLFCVVHFLASLQSN